MNEKEFQALGRLAFSQSLKPLQKKEKLKHVYVMGFDTEFDSKSGELLSRQYSFNKHQHFIPVSRDVDYNIDTLISDVKQILKDAGETVQGRTVTVYLACFYSLAEISKISGFFEDERVRIREFSQTINASIRAHRKLRIVIYDLYHFFQSSLEKVAEMYGLEKMKGIDRTNISRKLLNLESFREYAVRDASLCEKILTRFREDIWTEYQIDILRSETPASTALSVYRQNYLGGIIKNENLRLRRQSLRSYWGGRSEAFIRGKRSGVYHSCDITSLYPQSAINLGGLPREEDWKEAEGLSELLAGDVIDGVCSIIFEFPDHVRFPSLPVFNQRLLFPLRGRSNCTISELRVAASQGAKLQMVRGFYYKSGTTSLGVFLNAQMVQKDQAEKDGNEPKRHIHKLLTNAIIGKFVQRIVKTPLSYYQDLARKHQIPISAAYRLLDPDCEGSKSVSLGAGWCPEWGALILGKARASMAQLLNSCPDCLHVSTDSLLIEAGSVSTFDMIAQQLKLRWKDEYGPLTDILIIRSKLYVLSSQNQIEKCAHHALHLRGAKAGHALIAANLRNKDEIKYCKTKTMKLRESMRTGKEFFSSGKMSMRLSMRWDRKRCLTTNGETKPWPSSTASLPPSKTSLS